MENLTLGSGRETDLFHERPVVPKQYSSSMSPFFQLPTVPISNLNFGTVSNGGVATDFSLGLGYGLIQGWPRRMLVSVEFADAGRKTGTHRVLVVGGCSNTTRPPRWETLVRATSALLATLGECGKRRVGSNQLLVPASFGCGLLLCGAGDSPRLASPHSSQRASGDEKQELFAPAN